MKACVGSASEHTTHSLAASSDLLLNNASASRLAAETTHLGEIVETPGVEAPGEQKVVEAPGEPKVVEAPGEPKTAATEDEADLEKAEAGWVVAE